MATFSLKVPQVKACRRSKNIQHKIQINSFFSFLFHFRKKNSIQIKLSCCALNCLFRDRKIEHFKSPLVSIANRMFTSRKTLQTCYGFCEISLFLPFSFQYQSDISIERRLFEINVNSIAWITESRAWWVHHYVQRNKNEREEKNIQEMYGIL